MTAFGGHFFARNRWLLIFQARLVDFSLLL